MYNKTFAENVAIMLMVIKKVNTGNILLFQIVIRHFGLRLNKRGKRGGFPA